MGSKNSVETNSLLEGDCIEIELSTNSKWITTRVIMIPKDLVDARCKVKIGNWFIYLRPGCNTTIDAPNIIINTKNDKQTGRILLENWDEHHNDFILAIKTLNKMMEFDEENGIRFGKNGRWIKSGKIKAFEFPDEAMTMIIR